MLTDAQLDSIFLMQHIRARLMRHWTPADQIGASIYTEKEVQAKAFIFRTKESFRSSR